MNKLRWVGLILLLTLLLAPYGFTSNGNQSKGFENEFSFYGDVKVRGTPSGHLTVAVARSFPMRGIQPNGVPDVAFHFAPKKSRPEYQSVAFDLEGATVAFTSTRLTVFSAERNILLNVSLEKRDKTKTDVPQIILALLEGRARPVAASNAEEAWVAASVAVQDSTPAVSALTVATASATSPASAR